MKLRPFDSSLNEDYSMYDKLPYKKDIDLCGPDKIALESGNVIKFYQCRIHDTYQITGIDDLFYEKLNLHEEKRKEQKKEKTALEKLADTLLPEDEIETVDDPQLADDEVSQLTEEAPQENLLQDSLSDPEISASSFNSWDAEDWG